MYIQILLFIRFIVFNYIYTFRTNRSIEAFVIALGANPRSIDSCIDIYNSRKHNLSQRGIYCINEQIKWLSYINYTYIDSLNKILEKKLELEESYYG